MQLDPNFREFIASLNGRDARYLVVGGYAVALHGHPRYTGDLDLWLQREATNASRVVGAIEDFGFGQLDIVQDDFLQPDRVVQLGYPPLRIDLITSLTGVQFDDCYQQRVEIDLDGLTVPFISLADLRRNKQASARTQDRADLEALDGD